MEGERKGFTAGCRRRAGARSALAWSLQCPWTAGRVGMRWSAFTVCALLGVCAYAWRTPVLAASRQYPWAAGIGWSAVVSFSQFVRCWVCVCLCLAHTGTRLVTARRLRLHGHFPTASPPTAAAKARWPRLYGHGSRASSLRPQVDGLALTATAQGTRLPRPYRSISIIRFS
jgi:hypothetical protein